MGTLTKTEVILDGGVGPNDEGEEAALFGGFGVVVVLPRWTWDDMGCPAKVTVSVVPGDALNG